MAVIPEPGMEPGPEPDARLAAAYRAGAREEPSANLDAAIRAAARREVGAGPGRAPRWRNWGVPVSLAAVVVLSVTVVTMMRDDGADRWVRPSATTVPAETMSRQQMADSEQRENAQLSDLQEKAASQAALRRPAPSREAAQPMSPDKAATEPSQPVAAVAQRAKKAEVPSARIAADGAVRAEEDVTGRRDRELQMAAPRSPLRAAPAAPGETVTGMGSMAKSQSALSAAMADAPAALLWQDLRHEPAEKWILRIAELRRAGKTVDAEKLAAEFQRRFPDQRLPEDLR